MPQPPVVTYAAVARRLYEATDRAELDRASHLIQYLPSAGDRNFAAGIFRARADQFPVPIHHLEP